MSERVSEKSVRDVIGSLEELSDQWKRGGTGRMPHLLQDAADLLATLCGQRDEAWAELSAAREEAQRCQQDAERYRWLKANHLQTGTDSWIRTGDDLEEAIDAARKPVRV